MLNDDGEKNMLGIIAALLIVVWLIGFVALHVTAAFIHVALIAGLILLVVYFARRGTTSAYTAGQP
jgi:Flp pilus assembly protein TadB